MILIHILHEDYYNANGLAFRFPLYVNRGRLRDFGVQLAYFNEDCEDLYRCNVLMVCNKFFTNQLEKQKETILQFLEKAQSKVDHVIWCDLNDSTAIHQFEMLPYVSKYLKSQVLKDRNQYLRRFYGYRIYTDFYHKHFDIVDDDQNPPLVERLPNPEDLQKIQVAWSSALGNYGPYGLQLTRLRRIIPFPFFYPFKWCTPSAKRKLSVSCRINTNYTRSTVAFQRQEVCRRLDKFIAKDRLKTMQYFSEMKNSMAVLSPFGWGEFAYRDYEAIICGAVILKPNMDHMETWPNLWIKNETYLSWEWDFSDLERLVSGLEDRRKELAHISANAQYNYYSLLKTEAGHLAFCERFLSLLPV